ncbi:hypothetical protein FA13DRAFT_1748176 [Coprinellus micaceus]|uniref:Uncharacterized protein n=1 Tax=Coprinellus micaceus TaxID=71717 RepID=A0A4Y7RYY6_COPMI|nr:hypothetical protein FA13DRAFT_1748176 [Coprinellus micaceus]
MLFKLSTTFVFLAALAQVKAAPTLISRHEGDDDSASAGTSTSDLVKKNALEAQQYNARFADYQSQPMLARWSVQKCSTGTQCFALPLVAKAGTSLACDTQADANLHSEDGEDIPDCEEEEDDEETSTATPTASIVARDEPHFFDRRQASTILSLPHCHSYCGHRSNGIVTVTIVSTATVTVSATDCAATGTSSDIPVVTSSSTRAPLTVVSATPSASTSSTLATVSASSTVSSATGASTSASPSASVILLTSSPATGTGSPSSSFSFSVRPTQSA